MGLYPVQHVPWPNENSSEAFQAAMPHVTTQGAGPVYSKDRCVSYVALYSAATESACGVTSKWVRARARGRTSQTPRQATTMNHKDNASRQCQSASARRLASCTSNVRDFRNITYLIKVPKRAQTD